MEARKCGYLNSTSNLSEGGFQELWCFPRGRRLVGHSTASRSPRPRGQATTCKTLTTWPCDVETNATTTDRSAGPAPPSADVLPAVPLSVPPPPLLEGERFDLGGEDGSAAGRRGSRDRNANGIDTTSRAIKVIWTPRSGSTSKKSVSRGPSPMSPTQGDTCL